MTVRLRRSIRRYQSSHVVPPSVPASRGFVTVSGNQLMLNGKPWKAVGINLPSIVLDQLRLEGTVNAEPPLNTYFPSRAHIDDALRTAVYTGSTAIRIQTVMQVQSTAGGFANALVQAPGIYNERAWQAADYAIAQAAAYGLRCIVSGALRIAFYMPLDTRFAALRGKTQAQFYSDPQCITDYQNLFRDLLLRRNVYTGVLWRDDPTIFLWQLGNELSSDPAPWQTAIASTIRQYTKQLIGPGHQGTASGDFHNPVIDVSTGHYYPLDATALQTAINNAAAASMPFMVDEYDWRAAHGVLDSLDMFCTTMESNKANVCGSLWWALSPHEDSHGYVAHDWMEDGTHPGSTSTMIANMARLRTHHFRMRSLTEPALDPPAPRPFPTSASAGTISWRGSVGASTYLLERSATGPASGYSTLTNSVTDYQTPYTDAARPAECWYRITPVNASSVAGPAIVAHVLNNAIVEVI